MAFEEVDHRIVVIAAISSFVTLLLISYFGKCEYLKMSPATAVHERNASSNPPIPTQLEPQPKIESNTESPSISDTQRSTYTSLSKVIEKEQSESKHSDESKQSNEPNNESENKLEDSNSSSSHLLDIGMLPHHELDTFSMDEEEIIKDCKAGWSNCDAKTFKVRIGPNYVRGSGQKAPSKQALYKVFALDAYKLASKRNKIFEHMNIDKYVKKYQAAKYNQDLFPLPPLFILNFMIPDYSPELMSDKADGDGYQLIFYAHLSSEIANKWKQGNVSPAMGLLRDFIHSDLVNSKLRNRFKVIARIMNPNHVSFGFFGNRLVKQYNGTPFLAKTSSTFYHEKGKYFAADIDVHKFGYPARRGLNYIKDQIQNSIFDIGVVVEGERNEELPEQVLACCRCSKMGKDRSKEFPGMN